MKVSCINRNQQVIWRVVKIHFHRGFLCSSSMGTESHSDFWRQNFCKFWWEVPGTSYLASAKIRRIKEDCRKNVILSWASNYRSLLMRRFFLYSEFLWFLDRIFVVFYGAHYTDPLRFILELPEIPIQILNKFPKIKSLCDWKTVVNLQVFGSLLSFQSQYRVCSTKNLVYTLTARTKRRRTRVRWHLSKSR